MRPLIFSAMIVCISLIAFFLWDMQMRHTINNSFYHSARSNCYDNSCKLWVDNNHAYSFHVHTEPKNTKNICTDVCCIRLHLLQWLIEHHTDHYTPLTHQQCAQSNTLK